MLSIQQRRLPLHSPAISSQAAVLLHHAMAWHHHGNRIRATSIRHGAHRFGPPDRLRQLGVAPRLAGRYALQLFPHHLLKRGSAQVERNIQRRGRSFQQLFYLACHRLQSCVVAFDLRRLEIMLEFAQQRSFIFAKADRTDSARRGSHQQLAQFGRNDGAANLNSLSTPAKRRRSHPQLRRNAFIRAAAGAVARFIDRFCHAAFAKQRLPKLSCPPCLLILARADSQNALEQPLKVKWADGHVARDRRQAQRDVQVLIDVPAGRFHFLRLRIAF